MDEYLHRFAVQQSKKGIAVVRVLVDTDMPKTILGYYGLNAAQAVHSTHHGLGLGRLLMGCVVARCLEARKHVAAYALVVDAQEEEAKVFYAHYGFISCQDNPMILYLPLGAS
ncbi:GNAT family N-acetyltransferase [Acidithiobacillus ferriphilus]|uniref:GNAT family N-acetyltransferase n=1 Tax=Acidithiobacillus ferriphilus TaxID=1689834 RepID=UPI00232D5A4F|nr:GNAT family N-acetyltransferase [Acidithiobacillus ferriphilus]WCE93910.1 GNAT family N-acetyltransferase [Acidithiobacillus ferriphilus]